MRPAAFAALHRTSIFRLQTFDPSVASLSATSRSKASMIQKPARYFSSPASVGLGHTAGTGRSSRASPTSRASVGRILRAPGRPVDLERYALREGSRFDQVERQVRAGAGEQPRALADDHGADEQGDLVDQLVVEEPADQVAAAVHLHLASRLGLQLADGRREVTGEDGRVRPARVGERVRGNVLGPRVQGTYDGVP